MRVETRRLVSLASRHLATLEMRITDVPTLMEDTLTIAALYTCILRMLWRLKRSQP